MGDSNQGAVLAGQVQGVKKGAGVLIASDGTISFDANSAQGVVKTNNPNAFNGYVWPSPSPVNNTFLVASIQGSGIELSWEPVTIYGLGLLYNSPNLKLSVPALESPPSVGEGALEAEQGALYWNSSSKRLFIRNSGSWQPASYGPDEFNISLLTGKYHLFVNPEIGEDLFIDGPYPVQPGQESVTNQEAKWGYTAQKPFKTIQRAALEVARIQNSTGFNPEFYDRVVIHCSIGEHIIDNTFGSNSVTAWTNNQVPTEQQLRDMNSSEYGGVILPRGVSIIGEDLRKTIIRPVYVPEADGNIETDRASIFRVTGGAFFFNFSFKDKLNYSFSHHLLDCFSFVSDTDLNEYYGKVQVIFQQTLANFPANPGETEIVAPQPVTSPNSPTDGIIGSSPYVFNCSVRSKYGLCGINANGLDVTGFRSMVVAQFTGVSLQKDLSCWQQYNTVTKIWENTVFNYSTYVSLSPDNIRMDPSKRSFHVRAINDAFIQEVSVFAIGHGVHHWAHSGGELSITNSNSSFGGCSGIATGYKQFAFPQDQDWEISYLNVATNLDEDTNNVTQIYLGTIESFVANNATVLVLTEDLIDSELYPGTPEILANRKYSFTPGSYLWVENPLGFDFRSTLTFSAWSPSMPNQITVSVPMVNQQGTPPGGVSPSGLTQPNLAGSRVYIRRLVDVRPESRRKYSIDVATNNQQVRTPPRDYVLQTTPGVNSIIGTIPDEDLVLVNSSAAIPPGNLPSLKRAQLVLQRGNPENTWQSGNFYRPGDTVKKDGKHFTCVLQNSDLAFDEYKWSQSYVHMASDYNAYDFFGNVAPVIIFDNDTSGDETSTTCGYNLTTVWQTDPRVIKQYTSATDYRGVYQFLIAIGFSPSQVTQILLPSLTEDRKINPANPSNMKGNTPNETGRIATASTNWAVNLRRPSIVRMFGHAWEWAGYLNYTKALPAYQGELSPQNQFTYYFTNDLGGKVYATGYNQEGYLVTPAGLTDLTTNTTTGIANIGSPNQGEFPNSFDSLTVNDLTVTGSISGSPSFAPSFYTNLLTAGLGIDFSAPTLKLKVPVLPSAPPANNSPNGAIDGSMYWDSTLGVLFIRYNDGDSTQWVQAIPSGGGGGGGLGEVFIGPYPPASPTNGTLYWNSDVGTLYIWYDDGNSSQWVQATTGGSGNLNVTISSTPPPVVGLPAGSLYWNTISGRLSILYDDGDSTQWVQATPGGQFATNAEAITGTETDKALSPATGVAKDAPGMAGAAIIPSGTTAERPSPASVGMFRFNTDLGATEVYTGTEWKVIYSNSVFDSLGWFGQSSKP